MTVKEAIIMIGLIRRTNYKPKPEEERFMSDVASIRKEHLSYKQRKWLEMIYKNATGGGRYQRRQVI